MSLDLEPPPPELRTLQLLVSSLIMGVAMLAVVAILLPSATTIGSRAPAATLRIACVAVLMAAIPLSLVLRHGMLRSAGRGRGDGPDPRGEAIFPLFFTGTLIGCGLLEGAALFAVVVHLMTRDPVDLAIAAVPLLIMAIALFPTEGRWRRFVASVRRGPSGLD
ncbi:MAG: hypothetical protein ACYTJ0_16725 [Planctomycetota bacterium]|jgi:hypothetical protein